MVLRDSFIASEKVKLIMLTCICPGMRAANHTLNSLRYAERLKEQQKGGQGGQGASKQQKIDPVRTKEELSRFMEKHGKILGEIEEQSGTPHSQQKRDSFEMF